MHIIKIVDTVSFNLWCRRRRKRLARRSAPRRRYSSGGSRSCRTTSARSTLWKATSAPTNSCPPPWRPVDRATLSRLSSHSYVVWLRKDTFIHKTLVEMEPSPLVARSPRAVPFKSLFLILLVSLSLRRGLGWVYYCHLMLLLRLIYSW